jgi:helix-turn-helix protein
LHSFRTSGKLAVESEDIDMMQISFPKQQVEKYLQNRYNLSEIEAMVLVNDFQFGDGDSVSMDDITAIEHHINKV